MTAITTGLARATRRVAALEQELGRAAMLKCAIESDDRAFKLAAAFTVRAGDDARDHGRSGTGAIRRATVGYPSASNQMLRGERERVTSQPHEIGLTPNEGKTAVDALIAEGLVAAVGQETGDLLVVRAVV